MTELPYQVINLDTPLGGAVYPFLEQTGRAWSVISSPVNAPTVYPNPDSFGMAQPTLRWINGNDIKDICVDGMTTQEFLKQSGLKLDMSKKTGFVVAKRLSRLMRPYFASGFFPQAAVQVRYLDQDKTEAKVWDGAALISRAMLERLTIPPGVSEAKCAELRRELAHCQRVEFTLMTAQGQDKGHAIVADDLDTDFVLPRDTKTEVSLVNGQTFVGINFVHHHDEMRMDIQSLINLGDFFHEDQLAQWVEDDGAVFTQAVESGAVAEAMSRVEHYTTLDEVQRWALREYFVSGGQPLWFADVTKNLMNQHLDRLNSGALGHMRLPIPGGRFYVMPIGVGQRAGVQHDVPRGHLRIDPEYGTAWVNDADWVALEDSTPDPVTGKRAGLAGILGGADNDDALWLHGFTDHDGTLKVMAWRSPNQSGEYVVLKPTIGSYNLDWKTPEGVVRYPPGDSRRLPPRKDKVQQTYLNLVEDKPHSESAEYTLESMNAAIRQARENTGVLGMYCNLLMVSIALYGRLPDRLPAELEDVIDASVKTGADLSRVKAWCLNAFKAILKSGRPVPEVVAGRIAGSRNAPPPHTTDHKLDRLVDRLQTHIAAFTQSRNDLTAQAMPPAAVFSSAFEQPDLVTAGASLHHVYADALRRMRRQKDQLTPEDYDAARDKAEAYLKQFPPEQQGAILRGAMAAIYLTEKHDDSVLWLRGQKLEEGYAPGLAQATLDALREVGVLDEVDTTQVGVIAYPGAVVEAPQYEQSIGISGIWLYEAQNRQRAQGRPIAATMQDVDKAEADWAKARVAELAQSTYRHLPLMVKTEGERKLAYTQDGQIFGYIAKDSTQAVPEGEITLEFAVTKDGNLRGVWQQADLAHAPSAGDKEGE
jgi:hypothetical protein